MPMISWERSKEGRSSEWKCFSKGNQDLPEAQETPNQEILQVWAHQPLESWLVALAEGEEMGRNGHQAKRSAVVKMNACSEPPRPAGPCSQAHAYKPALSWQAALAESRKLGSRRHSHTTHSRGKPGSKLGFQVDPMTATERKERRMSPCCSPSRLARKWDRGKNLDGSVLHSVQQSQRTGNRCAIRLGHLSRAQWRHYIKHRKNTEELLWLGYRQWSPCPALKGRVT